MTAQWVAGVTPFLSILSALVARRADAQADLVLALPTREAVVMLQLLKNALCDA